MRSAFDRVAEEVIRDVITERWRLSIADLVYFPEGGGAYHWIARAEDGERQFVTCDDLDTKPWLGSTRDAVFDGLLTAYAAAADLRAAGLRFVVAPAPNVSGVPAERLDERHSLSVFPYVDGEPGRWGRPLSTGARRGLVSRLAQLHRTDVAIDRPLPRRGLDVPGRQELDGALRNLDDRWDGGPLSEAVRLALTRHRGMVVRWLRELDERGVAIATSSPDTVITHGEPHPGNLIQTDSELSLVDWDTVAVSRPERDLWMLAEPSGTLTSAYRDLTGMTLDGEMLAAFRLLWAVTDVAAFTAQLRGSHEQDADADNALTGLLSIFERREPAPYGTI